MRRRIALFGDGTWNSRDDRFPTNVIKLRSAVAPRSPDGAEQVVHYHSGIGTSGWRLGRLFDGLTGRGLSDNVRDAYRALVDTYRPGDAICLFGFSRGAFTVRSLAGLVRKCGVLRPSERGRVEEAYDFYRGPAHPDDAAATAWRAAHAVEPITPLAMIGVWDTVGSLGNPLLRHSLINRTLRFHDVRLSATVARAFQALAIDETRRPFQPALWRRQPHARDQVLRQVWFVGSHSDVGGGNPDSGLSDIALEWMARRAAAAGLGLIDGAIERIVGTRFPDFLAPPKVSRRGFYRLLPAKARDIDVPDPVDPLPTHERLHWTVAARWQRDPSYRPENLADYARRHPQAMQGDPRANPLLEGPATS